MIKLRIRLGGYDRDHKELVRIANTSAFTKSFRDVRYLADHYAAGGVLVAESVRVRVGFLLMYVCKVKPWTTIYYAAVLPEQRGQGIGRALLSRVEQADPHGTIRLGVDEANEEAAGFWGRMGFLPADPPYRTAKSGAKIFQYEKPNPRRRKTPAG